MGLPHFTIDLRDEFRAGVVEPFIDGYASGETPNPCVGCNGHVRLDAMLELADRLGCATLATGHYARTAESGDPAGPLLRAADDPAKDQTYMLAALDPAVAGSGCGSRSASCASRRSVRSPPRPGCRSRPRPTRRTCASSPAPTGRASWPATAGSATGPGELVDRPTEPFSASTSASTGSRSASAAASA